MDYALMEDEMNRHMKKRVCIITALILVMTALMGCGSGTQSGGSGQSSGIVQNVE